MGRALVQPGPGLGSDQDARAVYLTVTCNNDTAIMFYRSLLGFSVTGGTEPYPIDPELFEQEMIKPT